MEPDSEKQSEGGRKVKPSFRRFRIFSLRMLLLFVAVLGVAFAYQVNWANQRRAFLSDQVTRLESNLSHHDENARAQLINWWNTQQPCAWCDPWPLTLLREQPPVYGMFVLIPVDDLLVRDNRYEVDLSQSDLARARRLFPEQPVEDITPMYWKPGTPMSDDYGLKEVQIVK